MIKIKLDIDRAIRLAQGPNKADLRVLRTMINDALRDASVEMTNPEVYREHGDGYTRYICDCNISGRWLTLRSDWTEDFDNKK